VEDQSYHRRDVWSLSREAAWHPVIAWLVESVIRLAPVVIGLGRLWSCVMYGSGAAVLRIRIRSQLALHHS